MASDVDDVFLNTDEHAESVTYTPNGGSGRSIVVVILAIPSEIAMEGNHEVEHKLINVFAKRDATTGINAPAKGDTLTWQGRVYSWVGFIHEDEDAFQLKFSCPTILSTGPMGSRRF